MVLKRKCNQGCTVPNLCSWATRKSYNVLFSYKSYDGHPGLNKFRALGSLQFFLEHSWGLQKHDKLTTFFLHIPVTFPLPKIIPFHFPFHMLTKQDMYCVCCLWLKKEFLLPPVNFFSHDKAFLPRFERHLLAWNL